jgi:hypothetical protein
VATLIYKTTDADFAESCIQALAEAGVRAYRTGGPLPGGSSFTICVYIRDPKQAPLANTVLAELGAALDSGPKLPPRSVLIFLR